MLGQILMDKYVTGTEDELNKQMICDQKIVLYGCCTVAVSDATF